MSATKTKDNIMAAFEIEFEDFVAPVKAPSEYIGVIDTLIKAGPDKVASAIFATADEAKIYLRTLQTAAREVGVSAVKRGVYDLGKDGIKISVGVRDKISRPRPEKSEK